MASNSRNQIEAWLSTIEVRGTVLDVGGLYWPVMNRTKVWDVTKYVISDVKAERKGVKTNFIWDFNRPLPVYDEFDHVFAIEVTDHFWDTGAAFKNLALCTKRGGHLYLSSNFLFPHHTGFDCVRLTKTGIHKLLAENGFQVRAIVSRKAVDHNLTDALRKESKIVYNAGDIGYMVEAQKV